MIPSVTIAPRGQQCGLPIRSLLSIEEDFWQKSGGSQYADESDTASFPEDRTSIRLPCASDDFGRSNSRLDAFVSTEQTLLMQSSNLMEEIQISLFRYCM